MIFFQIDMYLKVKQRLTRNCIVQSKLQFRLRSGFLAMRSVLLIQKIRAYLKIKVCCHKILSKLSKVCNFMPYQYEGEIRYEKVGNGQENQLQDGADRKTLTQLVLFKLNKPGNTLQCHLKQKQLKSYPAGTEAVLRFSVQFLLRVLLIKQYSSISNYIQIYLIII